MRILLVCIALVLSGCATGNKNNSSEKFVRNLIPVNINDSSRLQQYPCPYRESDWQKSQNWEELVGFASSCAAHKKWNRVKEIARNMSQLNSNSPWGTYFMSLVAENKNNSDKALWMIDLSITKAPELGLLHYQKARLLWQSKDYELAVKSFEKAIELRAYIVESHAFLGQVFLRDQQFAKAQEHFEAVLKVQPRNIVALVGMSEVKVKRQDYASAVNYLEKALSAYPKNLNFRVRLARIYENHENDPERALLHYRLAQKHSRSPVVKGVNISKKIIDLSKTIRQPASTGGAQ